MASDKTLIENFRNADAKWVELAPLIEDYQNGTDLGRKPYEEYAGKITRQDVEDKKLDSIKTTLSDFQSRLGELLAVLKNEDETISMKVDSDKIEAVEAKVV